LLNKFVISTGAQRSGETCGFLCLGQRKLTSRSAPFCYS
jgi:hypothetical protein